MKRPRQFSCTVWVRNELPHFTDEGAETRQTCPVGQEKALKILLWRMGRRKKLAKEGQRRVFVKQTGKQGERDE